LDFEEIFYRQAIMPFSLQKGPSASDELENMTTNIITRRSLSSLLWLVGHHEWDQLSEQLEQNEELDGQAASTLLAFYLLYKAPANVVQLLLNKYPHILTTDLCNRQQLPFRIAVQSGVSVQTRIYLEAARQRSIVLLHKQPTNPQA